MSRFWKADKCKSEKGLFKTKTKAREARPEKLPEEGGHLPEPVLQSSGIRSGWRRRKCRKIASTRASLAFQRCDGPAAKTWQALAAEAASRANREPDGHTRVYAGDVVWCPTCGSYADARSNGMSSLCQGPQQRGQHCGGMWGGTP